MKHTHSRFLLLTAIALASACGDDADPFTNAGDGSSGASGDSGDSGDGSDTEGTAEALTFWQDAAPIFMERCATCHREGGIGPFSVTDPDEARTWATAIAASVEQRTMPPWLVTDDGSCSEYEHSRAMSDGEIRTLVDWVEAGAEIGDPRDDLSIPEPAELRDATSFLTPDFEPEIAGGVLAEFDEYRCFVLDPQLDRDAFLTGYDVLPGNARIVHHVLGIPVTPSLELSDGRTNLEVMQALDDESPDREGWPCFGAAGEGVEVNGIPVSWAPGQGVVDYPSGTGYRLSAGDLVVVQMHYNLADPDTLGRSDQSEIRLRLEDSVEREGIFDLRDDLLDSLGTPEPIVLEPGQESVEYTWEVEADDYLGWLGVDSIQLYGGIPHMHELGRRFRVEHHRADGQETCATEIRRWDFGWQLYYFYEEPITLGPGDHLTVTCEWDTRSKDEPVLPGWGTRNEMCLFGMFLVP